MRALAALALAAAIHVPAGYHARIYATGLKHPTALAFGPDSRLYAAEDGGTIVSVGRVARSDTSRGGEPDPNQRNDERLATADG